MLWLALAFVFMVIKENHNYRTLSILVSLLIVNLMWLLFKKLTRMPSSSAIQFDALFHSLMVGLAVLWLIANKLKEFRGIVRFLIALGIMVIISSLGILSLYMGFESRKRTFLMLLMLAFITGAILLSFIISGKFCRKKYRPLAFLLWLGLWLPLCSVIALILFTGIGLAIMGSGPTLKQAMTQIPIVGLIMGLFLYILNLPFMILGFVHPFFRERFCACLNLKSMPAVTDSDSNQPDMKS
jgi:hypothetical protein